MLILLVLIFKQVVDDVELLKPVVDEVRLPNTKPVVEDEVEKQINNYIRNLIFYHVTDFP